MKHKSLYILPSPNRVLIKITREQIENITSKWITREDGTRAQLFVEPAYEDGYDRKFMQNVSVGSVVAVGSNVTKVQKGDLAIIDYLVSNDSDVLVGYVNGDQLVCVDADTTRHTDQALPSATLRRAWLEGDYKDISPLMGVVRGNKVICFDPYIFLVSKSNMIVQVLASGKIIETKEAISQRTIMAAPDISQYKDGDEILIREENMFPRIIKGKEISVIFKDDVLAKIEPILVN